MMSLLAYNSYNSVDTTMGDELVGQHEGIDPELIAKGIFDEESEFPYINVPITFTNMNGICKQCNRSNTFANWCQPCNSKRFQKQYEADKKFSRWDQETNNWKRNYTGVEVLLKKIDDSCVHFRSPGDFLNEIKSQFKLNTCDIIIKCYGITRDPYTGTYFMVMQ
ncbi:unnamed protein product [Rhizophagus irregularis]|nr:unnamed protein product [Rhizophagus irregularis]